MNHFCRSACVLQRCYLGVHIDSVVQIFPRAVTVPRAHVMTRPISLSCDRAGATHSDIRCTEMHSVIICYCLRMHSEQFLALER